MAAAAEISHTVNPGTYSSPPDAEFTGQHEQRKSFDPVASVRMFRYDLEQFGSVLPETRERVQDEELSLIVEGVDRASRTTFALKRNGDDLAYYKNGEWCSYTGMLMIGKQVADKEAVRDSRRQFLAEDAANDLYHLYQMRKLQPGQQYVWHSPYRKDIEEKYGAAFMRECGRFPDRQMGFLYRAYCNAEGDVVLESQTVDRSNERAFAATMARAGQDRIATMGSLVGTYDEVLAQEQGGQFYAGRRDAEMNENAWQTILAHRDLIEFFLHKMEVIARSSLQGQDLEHAAKCHMYGSWAAFKRRIDGVVLPSSYQADAAQVPIAHMVRTDQEVHQAFAQFAAQGIPMVGCGGEIRMPQGEGNIFNANPADVFTVIFGKSDEDDRGPLTFTCSKGHHNRRPYGKLIDSCQVCRISVRC